MASCSNDDDISPMRLSTFFYLHMLKEDDRVDFVKARSKEIDDHEKRGHWVAVAHLFIPSGTKTIQSMWAFRRKIMPGGTLSKYKARLCAHGGMQQWGVNHWETYAPVVNWISIRFLLVLAELVGLESNAIDFMLAFPQADRDIPVYMELPRGMEIPGAACEKQYILLLNRICMV